MSIHVIRVTKGRFAKIWERARPKLLPEGLHAIDNPVFEYKGTVDSKDPCIEHGSIFILQIPKGALGLIKESNFPRLLEEGLHIYDSPTLQYNGVQSKLSPIISHGTISRFRICKGELGLAWRDNDPLLVEEPGTYQVDSATFKFVKVVDSTIKDIRLGSRKIITVYSGEVGVSFAAGRLEILPPGRHVIEAADHIFDDFLSTQQRAMRLVSTTKGGKKEEDLLVCDTKDLVKIGIRADVFYRITDPEKAIMTVGREGLEDLVMETSIATLTNIMRSTSLNDIATSSLPSAVSEAASTQEAVEAQALGQPCTPLFFDKAHDQFLAKLHDDFLARYGLEITNIRIEQFKIMDTDLANSISQQAINTAQTENQLANLEGQTQIATQQQEREKRVAQIQSETMANQRKIEAESKIIQAEAEGRAQEVRAQAEANQVRIRAEADARAIKIRAQATVAEAEAAAASTKIKADASVSEAKARADGIKLKASAESDRAKQLAATPLGEKLALLDIYSGVVKASNDGVQKVVYVDPTTTSANNPFALLTLQSLNRDLSALGSSS
jgi:regulator of protease activity HflC (stomatin/prohibitin superfamily)